jgi:hypothetical protein
VFLGKVTKIDPPEDPDASFRPSIIYFDVEQAFKGVNQTKVEGKYEVDSGCASVNFQVGKSYIIFGYRDNENQRYYIPDCIPHQEYSSDSDVIKFLNNFSQGKSNESITGRLITRGYKEIADATVTVSKDGKNYTTKTDDYGYFNIEVNEVGRYEVRVNVPFSSEVSSLSSIAFKTLSVKESETIVEYEARVKKGLCDHQQFNFEEVDLKATSSISGKMLSDKGSPVPNLSVYLAKAEILEKDFLELENREIVWADENGVFKFDKLREGRYIILINPDNFPDQDMPFLKTYFPGVNNFTDTMIIELGQNRVISGLEFKLPPQLPLRKIEGQVVWSDGKPATGKFNNSKDDSPPDISIYKPDGSYLRNHSGLKFNENGNFH